jgi:hypothetical protein
VRWVRNLRGRACLHDLALVHHRDAVGHAGDDGEVMGDQEEAHALLGHEPLQQVEDLRLRGDVERGGRLIGDQEPRVQRDGHGDADPLALAAGKLVRVGVEPIWDRPTRSSRSRAIERFARSACPWMVRVSAT